MSIRQPEPPMGNETVLVISDDFENRQLTWGHLVAAGYEVKLAASAVEGLARCRDLAPELIIVDAELPGEEGHEVCRMLRSHAMAGQATLLLLSAPAAPPTAEQVRSSGADDLLATPICRTELLVRVRALLRLHRLAGDLRKSAAVCDSQNQALARADLKKEDLTAFVVHDLKNPLASILANASVLEHDPSLEGEPREITRDILGAARFMNRMVMNLLDLSRGEQGTLVPQLCEVDVDRLVEDAAREAAMSAEERRQRIVIRKQLGRRTLRSDLDLVRRMLESLLENGIRYTPSGGTIEIEADTLADGGVELRVRDQGPSVPEAYRERIFHKEIRLETEVESTVPIGRGLALAFCRMAVEALGGRIWVEPGKPSGNCFRAYLPPGGRAAAGAATGREGASRPSAAAVAG